VETYSVSLVLENVELTDEVIDELFASIEDVVPSSIDGVVKVTAPVAASDAASAAFHLADQVQAVLPQAIPVRLDQDLVSIPDVAERTDRTRESIRLLVEGKRGPGGFPAPVGTVGDAIRVWPWAAVIDWFRTALGEDLGERGIPPETAALVDACFAGKRRPTFAHRIDIPWTPARATRTKVVATSYEVATTRRAPVALSA
jgi:hypothetical protein